MKSTRMVPVIAALLTAGLLACGCGSDNETAEPGPAPSALGESCSRSSDCAAGLACIANRCLAGAPTVDGGGDSGATIVPPSSTGLGTAGESCSRRADCMDGLGCFGGVCLATKPVEPVVDAGIPIAEGGVVPDGGTTEAGPGPVVQTRGVRGENCQTSTDCSTGLVCVPRDGVASGICDLANFGLVPTGKVCGGECTEAAQCCELPVGNGVATSCGDLSGKLGTTDCAVIAGLTPIQAQQCFYKQTYCNCAATTWSCTANRCVYAASCTVDGEVAGGCATRSRSGSALTATCDTTVAKCQLAAAPACTTSAECLGKPYAGRVPGTCVGSECTCYKGTCYRMCNEALDCEAGYTCDATSMLCTPIGACVNNAQCAVALKDVTAVCDTQTHTCRIPCTTDRQCSGSGGGFASSVSSSFVNSVCVSGYCQSLGCASDDECSVTPVPTVNVKMFCVAPAAVSGVAVTSAITD